MIDLNGYFSYATMLAAATHSSFALGPAPKRDTRVDAGEQPYVCRGQTSVNLTMRATNSNSKANGLGIVFLFTLLASMSSTPMC